MNIRSRKLKPWLFSVVLVLLFLLLLAGCEGEPVPEPDPNDDDNGEVPESPPAGRGNLPGHYDAIALEVDGWIYYTHFPYSDVRRVQSDGSNAGILSEDTGAASLNQVGNWIYYLCDAGMVRIHPDGSARELIYAQPAPYRLRYLSYVDGFFYMAKMQENDPDGGIIRIPFNDGEPMQISPNQPAGGMCVIDEIIYYSTGVEGTIYRMSIDGSNHEVLTEGFHPLVDNGYLYYARGNTIKRRHLETGDEIGLTLDLYGNSFQVSGDNIYYTHAVDGLKLHRANWGGGTEVVVSQPVWKAFIYESVILFQHHDDWKIYRAAPGDTIGTLLPQN